MTVGVRRAALVLIAAFLASFWMPFASAIENETFGVTPFPERSGSVDRRSFSIPLETGATFEDAVRVYNRTDQTINLALYATDAQTASDDTITVGQREDKPEGVGGWIDLSRRSVELEARGIRTVSFRVHVDSSEPAPKLGAIVVENTDRGLARNAAQRLHVLVLTVPPNTETASKRVRTFLLRSPWVALALLGLVIAGAVIWVGARRARRVKDVVAPSSLDDEDAEDAIESSRPVIKRLGASATEAATGLTRTNVLERVRSSAAARKRDDRPLLDDALLVEIDDDEAAGDEAASDREPGDAVPVSTVPRSGASERKAGPLKAQSDRTEPRAPVRSSKKAPAKPRAKTSKSTAAAGKSGAKSKAKPRAATTKKAKAKPKSAVTWKANYIPLEDL
jgi:hypothetical protein